MTKYLNVAQSIIEYLIAGLFVWGGISIIGMPPLVGKGVLVVLFGGQIALYIYIFAFTFSGLALIYAKVRRKKRLHKNILAVMYLTTIYTASLSLALGLGFVAILDDVVVGILTAIFWLRWKFRTEYIDLKEFEKDIEDLTN